MTKTKEKSRTAETVEQELEEVRSAVAAMRAELGELSRPPQIGWDGVSPETLNQIAEADTKRSALPYAITAGEVGEAELELELLRARRPEAQREIERAYAAWQKAEERAKAAQSKALEARYAHGDAIDRDTDLVREERRLTNELSERKAAATRSSEALGAPIVRSLWTNRR